ncbi:MAG: rhomboid family intramembrane serine protease [Sphingobacteriales bacterium]|nr:MAG: rhomboid family intramembrane serine protease [Sphingobacteriales bacterium]
MFTILFVVITCITSYLAFTNYPLRQKLIFSPYTISRTNEYFRFISSGLIHANWMHLLFNMFVLYQFGSIVEAYYAATFGKVANMLYVLLYIGGLIASEMYSFFKHKNNPYYASLGASGAVSSVVFTFILFNPWADLNFIFFPFIPIKAVIIGVLYLAYSYYAARNVNDNIGHNAHFYGAIFGIFFTLAFKPSLAINFANQISSSF